MNHEIYQTVSLYKSYERFCFEILYSGAYSRQWTTNDLLNEARKTVDQLNENTRMSLQRKFEDSIELRKSLVSI